MGVMIRSRLGAFQVSVFRIRYSLISYVFYLKGVRWKAHGYVGVS